MEDATGDLAGDLTVDLRSDADTLGSEPDSRASAPPPLEGRRALVAALDRRRVRSVLSAAASIDTLSSPVAMLTAAPRALPLVEPPFIPAIMGSSINGR